MRTHRVAVVVASCALATSLGSALAMSATPAGASGSNFKIKQIVNESTFVKKENQTTVSPPGTFTGVLNTTTGALKGKLKLPPSTSPVTLAGVGLAQATIAVSPTKPVTGKVNFQKFTIKTTSQFYLDIKSLTPNGTSVNLVGNSCRTATPITLTMSGPFVVIGRSTCTATFTIPPFANCLAMTPALTQQVSGPANVVTATFAGA